MFEIRLKGQVQGVGFRPFIYNLCTRLNICGFVRNCGADVIIRLEFEFCLSRIYNEAAPKLANFIQAESIITPFVDSRRSAEFFRHFFSTLPKAAKITKITIYKPKSQTKHTNKILDSSVESMQESTQNFALDFRLDSTQNHFMILPSINQEISLDSRIPQDLATCKECLNEIFSPKNRHYLYHLTSCVNCGARYSIINALPYDRKNTAMSEFALCKNCAKDYENPKNRYYHAQPISCNDCNVELDFWDKGKIVAKDLDAILLCVKKLKQGEIICIKGLGGFALICDASDKRAIENLRVIKRRPKKPFAVMAKNINQAKQIALLEPLEEKYLESSFAPIVLVKQNKGAKLSDNSDVIDDISVAFDKIAPNLDSIGILLANTPLQHILFSYIDFPLIYTSANLKGEPIITHISEARGKFGSNVEYFLDFGREIYQGIDDSIFRLIAGEMRPIRMARGVTPFYINLPIPQNQAQILALGAQDKTSLCFTHNGKTMIAPYIGDMQSIATQEKYIHTLEFFSKIYDFKPSIIVSDMHPRYQTTQIAKNICAHNTRAKHLQIYHHHAHLCAILAESNQKEILGFIWDGSGLGSDGKIWGGEVLFGDFSEFKRMWHFEEFLLLGGEKAIKEIDRIGYALSLQACHKEMILRYEKTLPKAVRLMAKNHFNSFESTSVGRLFDGVASLLGILHCSSYEGESGGILESLYNKNSDFGIYEFCVKDNVIEIKKMLYQICQDVCEKVPNCIIITKFIDTLAYITLKCSVLFLQNKTHIKVGFSGGVFQNKALCEKIASLFLKHNIPFVFHSKIPTNDNGIAFGQAIFGTFCVKE